jgi:hypothetical protein
VGFNSNDGQNFMVSNQQMKSIEESRSILTKRLG